MHDGRLLFRRASLALIAAGAAALALGIVLLVSVGSGDTPTPSDTDSDGLGPAAIVTATAPVASPTATPTEVLARPMRYLLARDGTVPEIERAGVLFLDPATGGGELWDFSSGGGFVRSALRSYRYVTYEGPNGLILLDTADDSERLLEWDGKRLVPVMLSPDGASFVGVSGSTIAVFAADTLLPIAYFDRPPRDFGQRQPAAVAWAADSSSVAVALNDVTGTIRVIFRGEELTLDGPLATTLQWSRDGTRLATAGSGAVTVTIYDLATGGQTEIPARGTNPRWSPDDKYLAIAHPENLDAARIFDAATGEEVLRVTGWPYCAGDYWYADGGIAGGGGFPRSSTSVPQGVVYERLGSAPDATFIQFPGWYVAAGGRSLQLVSATGELLAALTIDESFYRAMPTDRDGAHRITDDGRGVLMLGAGGRGLCDAGWPGPSVELPPFESAGWPDYKPDS